MLFKYHCDHCESKFKIIYEEDSCDDRPHYCPFCSEYLINKYEQDEQDD